jgi:hypothetical protein
LLAQLREHPLRGRGVLGYGDFTFAHGRKVTDLVVVLRYLGGDVRQAAELPPEHTVNGIDEMLAAAREGIGIALALADCRHRGLHTSQRARR